MLTYMMSMPLDLIVIIAAVVVGWLIFTWSIKVLKASISTALTIAVIALILQIFLGIRFEEVWQKLIQFSETVWQFFAQYLSFVLSRG